MSGAAEAPKGIDPKELLKDLQNTEKKTGGSGAVPNASKEELLDLTSLREKHPDKVLRFVNTANPAKVSNRVKAGWVKLAESEGGRTVGNLSVYAIPVAEAQAIRRRYRERDRMLLVAHKVQHQALAENMARILRDRHGIDVTPEQLIRG